MWSSRLFWKLFVVCAGLNLTMAIGFLVVMSSSHAKTIKQERERQLHDLAVLYRSEVRPALKGLGEADTEAERVAAANELQALVESICSAAKTRLTLVAANGDVLADSERKPGTMLNHANRPELIEAGRTGFGTATRTSPTLQIEMLYLAIPLDIGSSQSFVRVALPLEEINQQFASVQRFLWLFAIAVSTTAVLLTYAIVGRIINPLAQLTQKAQAIASGKQEDPVEVKTTDEVGLLSIAFNRMQSQLAKRFEQLKENNEQMATVLGSMDEGIIAVDRNENLLLANNAAKELLNFVDEGLGQPLMATVRSRPLLDAIHHCLTYSGSFQTEFQSVGHPRRDLAVHATCLPGSPPPGVVVVLHDITDLRRLENLRQEFVANVSHELKTPLASIKAYAETLRLGALNDPMNNVGFVERIEEQAERLHQLILDMLQIARIESGQEAFEIGPVNVGETISKCVASYADAASRKRIRLTLEKPDSSATVRADEEGLRTIVGNLLDNAIKYTPDEGGVTVRLSFDEATVSIEVADTGIGMSAHDQERVFERFYRADKARSRELGGTGLGLSIVKHLCQSFGGTVVLESALGEGSRFRVLLPNSETKAIATSS